MSPDRGAVVHEPIHIVHHIARVDLVMVRIVLIRLLDLVQEMNQFARRHVVFLVIPIPFNQMPSQ